MALKLFHDSGWVSKPQPFVSGMDPTLSSVGPTVVCLAEPQPKKMKIHEMLQNI